MNSEHPTVARHQAWFASGGILQYFVGCSESVRPLCICHAMWKTPLVLWPLLCTWRGLVRKSWSISAPFSLWKSFHAANIVALEAVLDGRWLDEWSANLIDITRTAALEIMFAFHNWSTLLTIWTHSFEKHIYLALWTMEMMGYQVFCQNYGKGIDWGPKFRVHTFELETKTKNFVWNKLRYFETKIALRYVHGKKLPIFSSYLENSFFVYSILVLSKQLPFSCKVGLTFDISCGDPTMHATRWSTKCELCLSNIQSSSLATGRRPIKVSKPILLFYQDFLTDQMSI